MYTISENIPWAGFRVLKSSTFVFITLCPPLVTLPSRLYKEETHPLTISLGLTKLLMKRRLAHQLVLQSLTLSLCQSNRGPEPRYLPNAAYTNISTPYRGKILQDMKKSWWEAAYWAHMYIFMTISFTTSRMKSTWLFGDYSTIFNLLIICWNSVCLTILLHIPVVYTLYNTITQQNFIR